MVSVLQKYGDACPASLLQQACWALWCITSNNTDNKVKLIYVIPGSSQMPDRYGMRRYGVSQVARVKLK